MALAKVVLVGRKNVGKSTLFNRLSVDVKSLTLDVEGVTRDYLTDVVSWKGQTFEVVDSGGISLKKEENALDEKVRQLGLKLVEDADLVIFVVDGQVGITHADTELNRYIYKHAKHVFLVINKADTAQAKERMFEFSRLGHKTIFELSAIHGTGIGELLSAIADFVADKGGSKQEEESGIRVALLGKPNVGKSSLMNLLLKKERAIVSDIAGTTREAFSEPVRFFSQNVFITDTPGVRRKRGVSETLETMMVKTTFKAIEHANIILMLLDGAAGKIADQELKLAFYAFEHEHKAVVLLINKEDLMQDLDRADLSHHFEEYPQLTKRMPVLFISCKTGHNVNKILPLVEKIYQRYTHRFSDVDLTKLFKEALEYKPLFVQGMQINLRKAQQVKTGPITIALFVNLPTFIDDSHRAYFDNVLRRTYELQGVPVVFVIRKA